MLSQAISAARISPLNRSNADLISFGLATLVNATVPGQPLVFQANQSTVLNGVARATACRGIKRLVF
jgi:hypothetical protein